MALSLIIFDCDGVLLESVDAKTRAFARIGAEFGQEAADRLVMFHKVHGGVNRREKFAWLFSEVLGRTITEEDQKALNKRFVEYCYDEINNCVFVPGVEDVLKTWRNKVPMYVASGAPQAELNIILKERGLAHYFDGIFGAPPGKTALLRNILEITGKDPAETIMIGDSQTDLTAAEAVNCLFYGRGDYFKHTPHPWHEDLTRLNAHLHALAAE